VVARQFEDLQGYQLNNGLLWLNQLLGDKAMDSGDIPYITQQYPFYGVVGQEKYFIPNLASIDALTFYIPTSTPTGASATTTVRYQMNYVDRVRYFGQPRANGINALPVTYTYERVLGGANIWVYFAPQQPFLFNITGNFFIGNVSLNQDLQSQITTANLGVPTITGPVTNLGTCTILGTGVLAAGELAINFVDLAGTYTTVAALVTAINTLVPNVTASASGSTVFLYGSIPQILISTLGTVGANGLTFANFSLTGGAKTQSFTQPGRLTTGQLVINGIDLSGTYPTVASLVAYINTGIIPFVVASITNFQFVLTSANGTAIFVVTSGTASATNNVTFQSFSTTNGYFSQNFYALAFDQFYTNYLEFQLAERICQKLNFAVPDGVANQLSKYRLAISKMAEPLDLRVQKVSCLGDLRAINYAQANIGQGYTTGGGF
jgi:hypothetical protein